MKLFSVCFLLISMIALGFVNGGASNRSHSREYDGADTIPSSPRSKRGKRVEKKEEEIKVDSATAMAGLELIGADDCITCHRINGNNTIGPSFDAIAAKYKPVQSVVDTLVQRTIKGSAGVWKQVPMTPHPRLKVADAQKMILFIFYLKQSGNSSLN